MRDINKKYKNLVGTQNISPDRVRIRTYVPDISDRDLKRGYITRHFVRKLNDRNSYIFEVDREELSRVKSFPNYIGVSLDWRLIGTEREIKESNRRSVKQAAKVMPNITLYLPNHKQFSRPSDQ